MKAGPSCCEATVTTKESPSCEWQGDFCHKLKPLKVEEGEKETKRASLNKQQIRGREEWALPLMVDQTLLNFEFKEFISKVRPMFWFTTASSVNQKSKSLLCNTHQHPAFTPQLPEDSNHDPPVIVVVNLVLIIIILIISPRVFTTSTSSEAHIISPIIVLIVPYSQRCPGPLCRPINIIKNIIILRIIGMCTADGGHRVCRMFARVCSARRRGMKAHIQVCVCVCVHVSASRLKDDVLYRVFVPR